MGLSKLPIRLLARLPWAAFAYNATMQKLFLNVAASLLFVELVILAQAPAGAAQDPAGPDVVRPVDSTNLSISPAS